MVGKEGAVDPSERWIDGAHIPLALSVSAWQDLGGAAAQGLEARRLLPELREGSCLSPVRGISSSGLRCIWTQETPEPLHQVVSHGAVVPQTSKALYRLGLYHISVRLKVLLLFYVRRDVEAEVSKP